MHGNAAPRAMPAHRRPFLPVEPSGRLAAHHMALEPQENVQAPLAGPLPRRPGDHLDRLIPVRHKPLRGNIPKSPCLRRASDRNGGHFSAVVHGAPRAARSNEAFGLTRTTESQPPVVPSVLLAALPCGIRTIRSRYGSRVQARPQQNRDRRWSDRCKAPRLLKKFAPRAFFRAQAGISLAGRVSALRRHAAPHCIPG